MKNIDHAQQNPAMKPVWLDNDIFTQSIAALPLISIDLCVLSDDSRLLLGHRKNSPAKGWWFTPGGRIRKGEPFHLAMSRIAREELGWSSFPSERATLMGVWDHFFADSAMDPNLPTHYINLPHYIRLSAAEMSKLDLPADEQHSDWKWMPIAQACIDSKTHPYARAYGEWCTKHI